MEKKENVSDIVAYL